MGSYRDTSFECFFLARKIHQQFHFLYIWQHRWITGSLLGIKGCDSLDQSDGSNRDQIICILTGSLIFFDHMCYQPEIMLDQDILCLRITLLIFLKIIFFLGYGQRFLKGLQIATSKGDFYIVYVRDRVFGAFPENFEPFYNYLPVLYNCVMAECFFSLICLIKLVMNKDMIFDADG